MERLQGSWFFTETWDARMSTDKRPSGREYLKSTNWAPWLQGDYDPVEKKRHSPISILVPDIYTFHRALQSGSAVRPRGGRDPKAKILETKSEMWLVQMENFQLLPSLCPCFPSRGYHEIGQQTPVLSPTWWKPQTTDIFLWCLTLVPGEACLCQLWWNATDQV